MTQKTIIISLLLLAVTSLSFAADSDWGKGAGKLSDWKFSAYKDAKLSETEFSGTTICKLGVTSPFLYSPNFDWDASPNDLLAVEIKSSSEGYGMLHFKHSANVSYVDNLRIPMTTPGGDDNWHVMLVPLKSAEWKEKISNIRLAFLYKDGVDIAIRRIKLIRKNATEDNLLSNGDFEIPSLDGKALEWNFSGNGLSCTLVPADKTSGLSGAFLQISGGKGTATLSQKAAYLDYLAPDTAAISVSLKALPALSGKLTATMKLKDALLCKCAPTKSTTWIMQPQRTYLDLKSPEFEIPLDTASVTLELNIESNGDGLIDIDDIRLVQRKGTPKETWTGEWIRPGDKPNDPPRKMFFRKFFDAPNDIQGAWLLCNCDNYINNIYINGKQLPPPKNAKIYNLADLVRIDDFVSPGKNIIAIEGYNFDTLGGVICDITTQTPEGWKTVGTDATWLSFSDEQQGWHLSTFGDSKWSKPITMGKGPATPFGDLEKPAIIIPSNATIKEFKATPKDTSPLSFHYSITLSKADSPTSLLLFVERDERYRLQATHLPKEGFKLATLSVKQGETHIEGDIIYPDFLPHGHLRLRLETIGSANAPAKAEIHVPGFKRPSAPAKFSFTAAYAPYLKGDGKELEVIHHWSGGKGKMTEELMGNCREEHVPYYVGGAASGFGWSIDGNYDFSPLDKFIYSILEVDPNAHFTIQVGVDNYFTPEAKIWLDAHPYECAMREDGSVILKKVHSLRNGRLVSHASKAWREEMRKYTFAIAKHINNSPYAHRAIALQPISGMGGEWCMWGTFSTGGGVERLDYSRPFRQYFSDFAIRKYGSLEKLNAAWGTEYAAPEEIRIPSTQERDTNDWFEFIDATKHKRIIDFRQSVSELIADDVIDLCEAIKMGSDNQLNAGTYYGYITYVCDPLPNRTEGGHFALGKILNSPHVDYLTHLLRYDNRRAGQPAGFMTPESSMLLHGKVPFVQADIRTHRVHPESSNAVYGRLNNLKEGIAVIQRDFCNALVNGVGYEFGYNGHGWISADRRMMRAVGRCREIERLAREKGTKRIDTENSVAVIVDDVSTYYSSQTSPIHIMSMKFQMPEFSHTGVGMDTYLLEDIDKMPEYKCYIFLNAFHITPAQQEFIKKNLRNKGKVLAFAYATGVAGDDGITPSKVQELTGIKMDIIEKVVPNEFRYVKSDAPAGKYLKEGKCFGSKYKVGPVFVPQEGTVLAKMTEGDTPALVVKPFADHTVCYSSIPGGFSSELVKGLAELAGITVINQEASDCTYVSDNMFAVHTRNGGNRVFSVPPKYTKKATELFTRKEFAIHNGKFQADLEPISTSIFLME